MNPLIQAMMTIIVSKSKYLLACMLAIFAPLQDSMMAVGALITLDFIFGILAAKKAGKPIKSKRMADTLIKALVYQLLVISGFVAETYLAPYIPLTKAILGFIAMVEIFSIGESFTIITGLPFVSYIKNIVKNSMKNPIFRDSTDELTNGPKDKDNKDNKDNKE